MMNVADDALVPARLAGSLLRVRRFDDEGPARTLNRLGKYQRAIDWTTGPALANPAQALLLSPFSGCVSLSLAIIRWSRMPQ
jgi:hypothetical protein